MSQVVNRTTKVAALIMALMSLAVVLMACSSEAELAYAEVAPAEITSGSQVSVLDENVILSVSGAISDKNSGESLDLDMATLERLGLVQYSIDDPWQNHESVSYTGVLMSDLLKVAGASENASTVHMVALDDYAVDVPMSDVEKWPILVATKRNGEYMSIENSGPAQIVFPFHAYPEIDEETYKVLMIWNLRRIEIR